MSIPLRIFWKAPGDESYDGYRAYFDAVPRVGEVVVRGPRAYKVTDVRHEQLEKASPNYECCVYMTRL
jgi:hypothetical protein